MSKRPSLSPEDIFAQALQENDRVLSQAEMRLLTSGLTALREHREKTLTQSELQSIKALIAFVAYTQHVDEDKVTAILMASFDTKTIETMPSYRYQDIVEYLVDLEINKIVN